MARPKRTSAKKAGNQAVKAAPVKTAEVKAAEELKVEEVTAAAEAAETETAKTAEEITTGTEETETKAVEETVAEPKKKGRKPGTKNKAKAEPATEMKGENVFVEVDGRQFKTEEVVEKVRAAWVAGGHRAGNIKKLDVYINMNELRAYYVINEKNTGSIEL